MSWSGRKYVGVIPLLSVQPVMRTVDFSEAPAIVQTSIFLRRMWLIDWSHGVNEHDIADAAEDYTYHRNTGAAIMQAIAEAPPEEKQDDKLWRQQCGFRLLEPPDRIDERDNEGSPESFTSHWRVRLYNLFDHLFADVYRMLRDELSWIADYKPPSVSLWVVRRCPSDPKEAEQRVPPFDRDTFVYPLWINPRAKVTFLSEDQESEHSWSPDASTWTSVLWVNGKKSKTVRVVADDDETVAAVLMLGRCEERETVNLREQSYGDPRNPQNSTSGRENEPNFFPESDVLARALFLRAGDAIETCRYNDASLGETGEKDMRHGFQQMSIETGTLYKSLPNGNSTRLLIIQPGLQGEEIQTQLVTVSLDDAPAYEALSYTWGDPQDHGQRSTQTEQSKRWGAPCFVCQIRPPVRS